MIVLSFNHQVRLFSYLNFYSSDSLWKRYVTFHTRAWLKCQGCKFSAEANIQKLGILLLFFTCKMQSNFPVFFEGLHSGQFQKSFLLFAFHILSLFVRKKNTMIILPFAASLFSDFLLEASLLLPLVFVFGDFLRWLSELLHSASAAPLSLSSAPLSETLDSKEESRKEELASENSDDDESPQVDVNLF